MLSGVGYIWGQPKLNPQMIEGKWGGVWTYFSSTGTPKSEGSAPLIEPIWEFKSNGTYSIQSSISETGKYFVKDSVLFLDTDQNLSPEFDKMQYSIVTLNEKTLELGSEITRSATFFMVSYIVFTRKN